MRYALFMSPSYYPSGGVGDLVALADDIESLRPSGEGGPDYLNSFRFGDAEGANWHIADLHDNLRLVAAGGEDAPVEEFQPWQFQGKWL